MIGHSNGFIKIVSINKLTTNSIYRIISLQEGEKLTCGVYSPSGHNFVIGTSFGSIYIGNMKRDPMSNRNQFNLFLARIDRVVNNTENAVTSIQMTS